MISDLIFGGKRVIFGWIHSYVCHSISLRAIMTLKLKVVNSVNCCNPHCRYLAHCCNKLGTLILRTKEQSENIKLRLLYYQKK